MEKLHNAEVLKINSRYKNELLEALNRFDTIAEEAGQTKEERERRGQDYELIYNFINGRL